MSDKNSSKNNFIMQAGILAAAGIISRIIGLLYRGPLQSVIGNLGLGYYQSAYNYYTIILLISSYSIPSAISKAIAQKLGEKEYRNAHRLFHGAMIYVLVVGGIASLFLFFGAGLFVSGAAVTVLRTFAPTIFVYGILGVLRGYFQAHKSMAQTSVSQILEQIANAIVSILAAWLLIKKFAVDEETHAIYGAAGGAMGTGAGVLTGLAFMLIVYAANRKSIHKKIARDKHTQEESMVGVMKIIFLMVTPIIFNTFVYNASSYLDSKIFSDILTMKGIAAKVVSGQWGEYSNYYITLINIPLALSSATSSAMMPEIATRFIKNEYKEANEKINEGIQLTMFLCIPAAVGLAVLAFPITKVLFPSSGTLSGQLLLAGSITVIFSALSTITNGVLQAIGKARIPLRNSAISLVLNVITVAVCSFAAPQMGVFSVLIASLVFAVAMCVLNAMSLKKYLGHKNDFVNGYGKPLAAAAGMGVVAWIVYYGLHLLVPIRIVCLGVSVILAALVYLILYVIVTKTTVEQMRRFPMGNYVVKVLRILKVFR